MRGKAARLVDLYYHDVRSHLLECRRTTARTRRSRSPLNPACKNCEIAAIVCDDQPGAKRFQALSTEMPVNAMYTEYFMRQALRHAREAGEGSTSWCDCCLENKIIARAGNQVETLKDGTAHAK